MRLIAVLCWIILSNIAFATTTLKISTLYPSGTDAVSSLRAVAELIERQTQGAVELKVYPGGVMGDDKTVLRKMKIGQLHGALVSGTGLDLINADLKDLSQPFQFDSLDQVYQARKTLDGEFKERLSEDKWAGFGPLDGGFSYLMSKQPVQDMDAVRDAKLWLPNTSDIQALSKQMNVNYLVMNIGDVLTGLDTGAIDTLISPPSAAIALNWHSRFNYYTETPVIYTWGMLVFPERALSKLSTEHRVIVDNALDDWATQLDERMRVGNVKAKQAITQLLDAQPFSREDITSLRLSQM